MTRSGLSPATARCGMLVKWLMPGAATTVVADNRSPPSSSTSKASSARRTPVTNSRRTCRPAISWNQVAYSMNRSTGIGSTLTGIDTALREIGLEGVHARRVEVPVRARAQQHSPGHVLTPETHRLAEHDGLDAETTRVGRHGQPVRASTDDCQ